MEIAQNRLDMSQNCNVKYNNNVQSDILKQFGMTFIKLYNDASWPLCAHHFVILTGQKLNYGQKTFWNIVWTSVPLHRNKKVYFKNYLKGKESQGLNF